MTLASSPTSRQTRSASSTGPGAPQPSGASAEGGAAGAAAGGRQLWWWVRAVGSWFVLLAVLLVVLVAVALPTLAGGTAYTVLSPSMRPSLPPGALVVTRPVRASDLAVGDVVTYQIRSGEPAVITHRVLELRLTADGEVLARTKGDFNAAADPELVQPEQLRGRLWYSVPYLGYVSSAVAGHGRVAVVGLVVLGLVGYALWMFVSSARDRRRVVAGNQGAAGTAAPDQVDRAG